jgi:hypothetical protein
VSNNSAALRYDNLPRWVDGSTSDFATDGRALRSVRNTGPILWPDSSLGNNRAVRSVSDQIPSPALAGHHRTPVRGVQVHHGEHQHFIRPCRGLVQQVPQPPFPQPRIRSQDLGDPIPAG